MERETTGKQAKRGGPSGARSRDLRIKRPDSQTVLQQGNSSAENTTVFFREPTVHSDPLPSLKNRGFVAPNSVRRRTLYFPVLA